MLVLFEKFSHSTSIFHIHTQVTVYGQSAGAESIGVLMTSPYGKDLFHQGIMESNPFGLPFRDVPNAKEFGSRFASAAGCLKDDMDCLRSV